MPSAYVALQSAIRARVVALLPTISVFDHVPQDQPGPFIVVRAETGRPADTKTRSVVEHDVVIDLYSLLRGFTEVKGFADTLYAGLQKYAPTVTGTTATPLRFQESYFFEEPDGVRGVLRFTTMTT